jgi:sugar lactone lactonase YvrE
MKPLKFITCITSIAVVFQLLFLNVSADLPFQAYNYTTRTGYLKQAPCPSPFIPVASYDSVYIGESLKSPADIFIDDTHNAYIVDSVDNKVVVTNAEFKVTKVIKNFKVSGEISSFSEPKGVFVCSDGEIYVADTGNQRIVRFDTELNVLSVLKVPDSDIFGKNYVFKPIKLVVDNEKRLYVIAKDQFNGIMQFDSDGTFLGFLGSNMVNPSPFELIWKRILSKQQKEQMTRLIPLEYTNVTMDKTGFLYVVTQATNEANKVKKLSPDGKNILTVNSNMLQITRNTMITDICVDNYDNYYYIDNATGNINVFNKDGYMLYAFGNLGNQLGTFKSPSAIEIDGDYLYVTDMLNSNITVFKMSEYATKIRQAYNLYNEGEYQKSMGLWQEITRFNANFELGYMQIGSIYYKNNDYKQAMHYFKLGNYRGENYVSGYSEAFKEFRNQFLRENLNRLLTGLIIIAFLLFAFRLFYKHRKHGRLGGADND